MALWVIRAGKHGEYEERFIQSDRIYLTWYELTQDLEKISTRPVLREILDSAYPGAPAGKIANYLGQIWAFVHTIKPGDRVFVPLKAQRAINLAEVVGDYQFDAQANPPFQHFRKIKWVVKVLRSAFDEDMRFALDVPKTVFPVLRPEAEDRLNDLLKRSGQAPSTDHEKKEALTTVSEEEMRDLEELARDQIAKLVIQKFKGHGLARLVGAILKAQGYTTYISPEGPDKGIDILAGPAPMGFGRPRLCVQVKSGESPVDSPTLNQLIGSMKNVGADQGLLVSWGGFKSSVLKEEPTQFFCVRLWDQGKLMDELLSNYDKLDEDLRAELPLKRIWTTAIQDEID